MDVSPRPTAPLRRRQATRARIRRQAVGLFAERGLAGVTSHEIAAAAGVAAGTFYLHFKDKHALFREIVQDAVERLQARFADVAAETKDLGVEAQCRARVEALLGFAEDERALVGVLFARHAGPTPVTAEVLDQLVTWVESDLVVAARPAVDVAVAAQAIVGMWARVCAWWAESPGRAPREDVIQTLVAVQLTGTSSLRSPANAVEPEG